MINFTVDLLASFFAVRFAHIRTSIKRLILCSVLGAACAIIDLFLAEAIWIRAVNCVIFLIFIALFISRRITVFRRFKFVILFFAAELTIGGVVYFGYSVIDRYFSDFLELADGGSENQSALIFSILILLAIGVFKLLIMLFSNSSSEKVVKIKIEIENNSVEADALIDSGNLVKDPMNMNPVLFVKPSLAEKILPTNVIELTKIDNLDMKYQKRIRLIPVTRGGSTHVVTGIRVDKVSLLNAGKDEISVTVAIDKEGGSFGGFEALMPSAAVNDVL